MTKSPEHLSGHAPGGAAAEARKRWQQAAFRSGMIFILLPALVPLPLLTTVSGFPHSLPLIVACSVGWIVLVCASVAYGAFRIRKYKRDHPFVA